MRFVALLACAAFTATLVHASPLQLATPGLKPQQPQVAVADGIAHVVFGSDSAIYTLSLRDSQSVGAPVKVGDLPKLGLGMRRGPRITACGNNRLVVTAISHEDGMVHCFVSADAGKTWEKQAPLNTVAKSAREGLHAMACDERGHVCVAWLDLRNGGTELWSRVSADGGATWRPEVRVYASPDGNICECCHPSLAISPKGEIAAMWRNWVGGSRDMWLAISRDGGKTFGTAEKLGAGTWKMRGCPMDGGAVTFASDGKPVAVWRREKAVFSGAVKTREDQLTDAGAQPVMQSGPQGVVIAWEERGGIMIKRAQDGPQQLTQQGRAPALATISPSGTIAVWETQDGGIMADFIR